MKNTPLFFGVGVLLMLLSCSKDAHKENEETYKVISPIVADTVYTNDYVAEIMAFQNVEVRTRIKGFIENVYVDEGRTVRKGQTLFSISSKEFQQALLKTKAATKVTLTELKSAEMELNNSQKLFDKTIISKSELDMVTAKVEALKAKVEEAEAEEAQASLNLSFTEIKAPFDGIINRIPNKAGSLVEEGALLTTISNDKDMLVYFRVSETDYLNYIMGKGEGKSKEVLLVLANEALYNHTGIIETIESEFEKSTGNIAFRAIFPNPERILRHGAIGKVQVKTKLRHAMLIPQKSTFEIQENIYVFVLDEGNKVVQRKITPSFSLSQLYVVSSGLAPSDKIVYEGIQNLKDGDVIVPEDISFSDEINTKN